MDSQKANKLNKLENVLYVVIIVAIVTDVVNGNVHSFIFGISTATLITGILGIISIEFIKLQAKQKHKRG